MIALFLTLCLPAACAQAGAMPPGGEMLEVFGTEGLLNIGSILPLPDGGLIIGGQTQYPGEYRQGYRGGSADMRYMVRNDAIAMRMDPAGRELWRIRLGDPHANNSLNPVGLLPDRRILMWFVADDTTFGDRYFIAGPDGVVEEMLPWRTMADIYPPRSMVLMPESGYLGGDSTIVDDYYDYHTGRSESPGAPHSREMTLLDFDLNLVWSRDTLPLGPWFGNHHYPVEVRDGIVLYGMSLTAVPDGSPEEPLFFTSVVKLDKGTGETVWRLTDEPRSNERGMYGARSLVETPDGSLLFTGAYLEQGRILGGDEALHTLTKLTAEGELLGTLAIGPEADRAPGWLSLTAVPDGTVYISGPITTPYGEETETGGDLIGSFLGTLRPEYFTSPEGFSVYE